MPGPLLTNENKAGIAAVEDALNTAIGSLDPADRLQAGALQTLRQMRRLLEQIRVERG